MKDVLNFQNFSAEALTQIIDLALQIKKNPAKYSNTLNGKRLALLFQKTSTRTRCSAEMGMNMLGGHAMYLDFRTTNFALMNMEDEARVLSSYVDVILARLLKNQDIIDMAAGSLVPVINGLCNKFHPCQALADMLTIKETFGSLNDIKIAYLGIANNVSNSLTEICLKLSIKLSLGVGEIDPSSYDESLYDQANSSSLFEMTDNVEQAVCGANVVYTDTWINLEYFKQEKSSSQREKINRLMNYQLNENVLKLAQKDAKIMHDLPAHEGYEIAPGMLHHKNSLVFTQAENRLWSVMALFVFLLTGG
jgi:ornithine carbamoyltransferase